MTEERKAACINLAKEIVHAWWGGELNATLHDVYMDFRSLDRSRADEAEWETIGACMSEHQSSRCRSFTELIGGHILDNETKE